MLRLLLALLLLLGCTAEASQSSAASDPIPIPTLLPDGEHPTTEAALDALTSLYMGLQQQLDAHLRNHDSSNHDHRYDPDYLPGPGSHTHENDHNHFGGYGYNPGDHTHEEYAHNDHTHWDLHTHGGW